MYYECRFAKFVQIQLFFKLFTDCSADWQTQGNRLIKIKLIYYFYYFCCVLFFPEIIFFIQRVIFVYIILSSRWKIFIFPFLSHLVKSNIKLYGKWLEFKWSEYVYPHHALQIKAHHSGKKPVSLLIAVSRLVNTKKTYRESAKQHWINQINGNHLN